MWAALALRERITDLDELWHADRAPAVTLGDVSECGECRYDFGESPDRLAERCAAFGAAVTAVLGEHARQALLWRPAPRTWSPLEYAAHVSEAVPWYVGRVRRVLREADARLAPFDWDRAASEGGYRQRGVETVAGEVLRACAELAEVARAVTEDDLARAGTGSDGTPRTVRTLLARAGHELAHHELDIHRGLTAWRRRSR